MTGAEVAAIPTTMSGAEMTGIHRLPAGAEARVGALVRPALVIADPVAMTSQPEAAAAGQLDERARPRRRLALHALRQPGLGDGGAARRGADRDRARPGPRASATRRRWRSARSSAATRSTPACSASTTSSARPWSASAAAPTPRPTRRSCRGRWPCWSPGPRTASPTSPPRSRPTPRTSKPASCELGGDPPGLGEAGADRAKLDQALDVDAAPPRARLRPRPAARAGRARGVDRARLVTAGAAAV